MHSPKSRFMDKKPCAVCGDAGDGAHFGAEACRACAAFFRRSVALEKKYSCRANYECVVDVHIRCMCRACRFQKCLAVGMRETAVQRHRENRPPDSGGETPELELKPIDEQASMPTLLRLRHNYQLMDNVRKVLHNREGDSVFAKKEPRVVDYKEANEINVREIGLVADFIVNSFEDFEFVDKEQKKLLFRNFFLPFMLLETGYFCALNNRTDIIVMPTGDYIDTTRPETFYRDCHSDNILSKEDAIRMFSPSFEVYTRNLLEPMRAHKVDDIEFFSMCACVLWDHGLDGQTAECETTAIGARNRILKELLFYYKYVKRHQEPAERMSQILILLPALQRAVRRFAEDVEISHVFNVFSVGEPFYDIINGRFYFNQLL